MGGGSVEIILVWPTSLDTSPRQFICVCIRVSGVMTPYCLAHDQWLILLVWPTSYETQSGLICIMRDGAMHYKLYLLKLAMAVDNCVFNEHFTVHINLLCMCVCTIPSNGTGMAD